LAESLHIDGTESIYDLRTHHLCTHADATLDLAALRVVLNRFLVGELSSEGLEELAEFYETTEWIVVKPDEAGLINDAVFLLANPAINLPNSRQKVKDMLTDLGG